MIKDLVTPQWLHNNKDNPNLIILDASPESNKSGLEVTYPNLQIPGAIKFDIKNKFSDLNASLPNMLPAPKQFEQACQDIGINKDSILVVYDNLGIYTSPRVWWMFKTMGHDTIAILDGGLTAWIDAGYAAVAICNNRIKRGDFKANFNPHWVVDTKQVKEIINNKNALLIDARSKGRFYGITPDPRPELPRGHIPTSVNLPFKEVLQNGTFKNKESLQELFSEFNTQDTPLVFTCGSGITACIVLVAAHQVLPNKKAVYDGSWTAWALSELV